MALSPSIRTFASKSTDAENKFVCHPAQPSGLSSALASGLINGLYCTFKSGLVPAQSRSKSREAPRSKRGRAVRKAAARSLLPSRKMERTSCVGPSESWSICSATSSPKSQKTTCTMTVRSRTSRPKTVEDPLLSGRPAPLKQTRSYPPPPPPTHTQLSACFRRLCCCCRWLFEFSLA